MWNCYCVWFLFFFLTNDVSTFQKNKYCKNRLMNELIDSKNQKNCLLIQYRLISTNKKIDYWLNVDWFFKTKKFAIESFRWFENVLCKFFIQFTKIRFVISWFFQKIWIENQMNNIYRFQKKISHVDDFLLIRVFLRMIRRFFFDLRIFTNDLTIFFNHSRIFTNIFNDFI